MFFDNTLMLADAQAVTADAAGTVGGNASVLQLAGDDYSRMWVAILVDTAFTTSGSPSGATIVAKLQTSNDSTFSDGVNVLEEKTINIATAKKGDVVAFRLPLGTLKYTRVYFDVTLTGGTTPAITAGKLTVGLTDGIYTAQ